MENRRKKQILIPLAECVVTVASLNSPNREEKESFAILADNSIPDINKEYLLEQILVSRLKNTT